MKPISEIVTELANSNRGEKWLYDFVCVGRGNGRGYITSKLDIPSSELYSHNPNGDFESGYAGSASDHVYYITQELFKKLTTVAPEFKNCIDDALKLMGKTLGYNNNGVTEIFVADEWVVVNNKTPNVGNETMAVVDADGFSVNIGNRSNFGKMVPISKVFVVKTTKLKLNSQYDAIISKNQVAVGCQTFNIEKIREILKLHDSL